MSVIKRGYTSNYIGSLFNNEKLSDFTIKFINTNDELDQKYIKLTNNSSLPCHKLILSQSPVLAAMFDISMQEQLSNEMIIDGNEEDIGLFLCMISWLYEKPIVPITIQDSVQLILLFDKYQLGELCNSFVNDIYEMFNFRTRTTREMLYNGFFTNLSTTYVPPPPQLPMNCPSSYVLNNDPTIPPPPKSTVPVLSPMMTLLPPPNYSGFIPPPPMVNTGSSSNNRDSIPPPPNISFELRNTVNILDLLNFWNEIFVENQLELLTCNQKSKFKQIIERICKEIIFEDSFNPVNQRCKTNCLLELKGYSFELIHNFLDSFIDSSVQYKNVMDLIIAWINYKETERKSLGIDLIMIVHKKYEKNGTIFTISSNKKPVPPKVTPPPH
ncbi:hypothetical protein ABK040_003441 [Willaertia magna]